MPVKKLNKSGYFYLKEKKEEGLFFHKITIDKKVKFIGLKSKNGVIEEKYFDSLRNMRNWLKN